MKMNNYGNAGSYLTNPVKKDNNFNILRLVNPNLQHLVSDKLQHNMLSPADMDERSAYQVRTLKSLYNMDPEADNEVKIGE